MGEEEKLRKELKELESEHKELGAKIESLMGNTNDQLMLQRLKKRKLWLKDKIAQLYAMIYDDIIA